MEEGLNGHVKDGVHQNDEENGIKAELDDETLRMGTVAAKESFKVAVIRNGVENGKEEKGFSSSSSSSSDDEEAEVIVTEKTDDESAVIYKDEDEVSDMTVEEAAETEELKVVEVIKEDISEDVETAAEEKGYTVEEERELITTKDSQTVEADVAKLADLVSDHVESAEEVLYTVVTEREVEYAEQEVTNDKLQSEEDDSNPTIGKPVNGTDVTSHDTDIPETNGNPQIISISARTMQPTSWRGCCGLLEVFKRGDR